MKSSLQERIKPMVQQNLPTLADKKDPTAASEPKSDVDFLKLLNSSNAEVKREREAKKNGDLSGAKSYDEFLDTLNQQTKKLREPKNNLDKDDFLTLFVTQLQNQDPLNPEDSTQMASRLAQFNSLEQMLNVNTTLEKMYDHQTGAQNFGMINYIGKEVEVEGGRVRLTTDKNVEGSFKLERPAQNTELQIRDGSGSIVHSKPLGSLMNGEHKMSWDGKNAEGVDQPPGLYTYSIVASGDKDQDIPVNITSKAMITGVDLQDTKQGIFTDLGRIGMADIKSIGESGYRKPQDQKPSALAGGSANQSGQLAMANAKARAGAPAEVNPETPKPEPREARDTKEAKEKRRAKRARRAQAQQAQQPQPMQTSRPNMPNPYAQQSMKPVR